MFTQNIMQMAFLDSGRLGFTQAVELSYLLEYEQQLIVQYLESNSGFKLSYKQAEILRALCDEGKLDADSLGATLICMPIVFTSCINFVIMYI